jgi:hypothetical protein
MLNPVRSLQKFGCDLVARSCALMKQFGLICTEVCVVMKQSKTLQHMSLGSNGVDQVRSLRKIWTRLSCMNLRINDPVRPDLHQSSCSNETVKNAVIQEFGFQ